ncbi:hypothetical protein ACOMHN_059872 [Nucella lapillus]
MENDSAEDDAEAAGRAPHITKPQRQPTGSSDQKAPEAADGLLGLFPLMRPALRDWRILSHLLGDSLG